MKTRHPPSRWQSAALIAGLLAALAAPARAAGTEAGGDGAAPAAPAPAAPAIEDINARGLELYAARDYRRALEKFIEAEALSGDPNLLFNIARCYENMGDLGAALEKYELFVAAPGADPSGVERAKRSMDAIREAQQRTAAPPPDAAPTQAPDAASEAEAASAPPLERVAPSRPEWLPWLAVGGSVAFTVAGATFYSLGASDHGRVTRMPEYGRGDAIAPMTRRRADELVRAGDTKKLVGGIGLGLGGALAAAAVGLFSSGEDAARDAPRVELQASAGGGALRLTGTFH